MLLEHPWSKGSFSAAIATLMTTRTKAPTYFCTGNPFPNELRAIESPIYRFSPLLYPLCKFSQNITKCLHSAGSRTSLEMWLTWVRIWGRCGRSAIIWEKKNHFFLKGLWRKIVIRKNMVFDQKFRHFVFALTFFVFKKSMIFYIEVKFHCGSNERTHSIQKMNWEEIATIYRDLKDLKC